jgi:hypothetical protein
MCEYGVCPSESILVSQAYVCPPVCPRAKISACARARRVSAGTSNPWRAGCRRGASHLAEEVTPNGGGVDARRRWRSSWPLATGSWWWSLSSQDVDCRALKPVLSATDSRRRQVVGLWSCLREALALGSSCAAGARAGLPSCCQELALGCRRTSVRFFIYLFCLDFRKYKWSNKKF